VFFFFFSSRRRHTRFDCDWSSDVCSSDLCDRLGVLIRIVLPLSAPAFVVVALFSFTQAWNEFLYALVFTNSVATRTVTVGLTQKIGRASCRERVDVVVGRGRVRR